MASKLSLPVEVLQNLKCSLCMLELSVYPVHIKIDGKMAVCGRCKVPNDLDYIRDEAYELIAQFILFTCPQERNGCKVQLTPLNMKDHELACTYKKIACPSKAYLRCEWCGPHSDLKKHFEESHKELLLTDQKFEVNFVNSLKESLLLPFKNEIFIIKNEVDARTQTLTCEVEHIIQKENPAKYNYHLRLDTGNQTYSYKCPQRSTSPASDERVTKLLSQFINDQLCRPATIIATVEIVEKNFAEEVEEDVKGDTVKNPEIDWEMLSDLECPVCFEYMPPPIYQCLTGHCICATCKPSLKECPICKAELDNTQNFTLEKVAMKLNYPCKYYKMGCPESFKSTEIRTHEESCEYGPYDCPVGELTSCKEKCNRSKIINHIEIYHGNYILKSDRINIAMDDAKQECDRYYLIKFRSKLFKLCFAYREEVFKWVLQLVGPAEESKNYKYEIDIIDNTQNNLKSCVRALCRPYTKHEKCFDGSGNVEFLNKQISNYITDTLSFRIRVLSQ
ncbi:uncharacterized protein LOC132700534 [Cylas formicarius]|uniref:uncharacterized protein LOC132700534 n=1 Tax=Cylas formicarius TaxID=197179 RepID=UPI00295892C7|nr:uncharacterized protein LOC132700534 [Cylas formicarius]